jgi:uncharacterized protein (TIGR00369 family)
MAGEPRMKLDRSALSAFLREAFPLAAEVIEIEEAEPMRVRLRMRIGEKHLRPGGTVSGPAMFTIADSGFYLATLAMVGPEALAVTTQISINFLRKPPMADLICEARLLKLGRRLAVGDSLVYSEGMDEPVAQASGTYSIPPWGS